MATLHYIESLARGLGMNPTYELTWASLEIWHGMQEGNPRAARTYIVNRLKAGDAAAFRACRDFREACIEHSVPFDLDYDID